MSRVRPVWLVLFVLLVGVTATASAQCLVCQNPNGPDPGPGECRPTTGPNCTGVCCWGSEGDPCIAPDFAGYCFAPGGVTAKTRALLFEQFRVAQAKPDTILRLPRNASAAEPQILNMGLSAKRVIPSCECAAAAMAAQRAAG